MIPTLNFKQYSHLGLTTTMIWTLTAPNSYYNDDPRKVTLPSLLLSWNFICSCLLRYMQHYKPPTLSHLSPWLLNPQTSIYEFCMISTFSQAHKHIFPAPTHLANNLHPHILYIYILSYLSSSYSELATLSKCVYVLHAFSSMYLSKPLKNQ